MDLHYCTCVCLFVYISTSTVVILCSLKREQWGIPSHHHPLSLVISNRKYENVSINKTMIIILYNKDNDDDGGGDCGNGGDDNDVDDDDVFK